MKEECFGLLVRADGTAYVGGPTVADKEFARNYLKPSPTVLSIIRPIGFVERDALYGAIDDWNREAHAASDAECIGLVDRLVRAAGLTPVELVPGESPGAYLKRLARSN